MNALIRKELRENLKLALPGLLVHALMLWRVYQNCDTQPLLTVSVLRLLEIVCSGLGLGLGWFQVHHEKDRDLWGFLIHRPLTRSAIFLAKVISGLGLYSLAAGLPLFGLIIISIMPGHFGSPFEWAMLLPVGGIFLMGMVWYFAGLVTGTRQVRWYASRTLALAAALLILALKTTEPSWLGGFRQEYFVLAIGGAILALTAWGAFQGDGSDGSQPAWGKRALTLTLTLGVIFFALILQSVLESIFLRGERWESSYSEITRDGRICQVIRRASEPAEIMDLAGAALHDPETGQRMNLAQFDKLVAQSYPINVDFGDQSEVRDLLQPSTRFFSGFQKADRVAWYWVRNGELAGYETSTMRLVGTIEPKTGPASIGAFLRPQKNEPEQASGSRKIAFMPILATTGAVCRVNLKEGKARVVFSTTKDDPIGGARSIGEQTIVVTRHFIQMISLGGEVFWKVPYESSYPRSMWVKVSRLDAPQQFAIWVGPYHPANRQNKIEGRRYTQVLLVSAEQGLLKRVELVPPSSQKARQTAQTLSYAFAALLMPPVPIFYKLLGWQSVPWGLVRISLAGAVACVAIGWWLGRRYSFSFGAQMGWAAFHLFCGLPGFLAFLSVQEWPARERCPNCKKMRIVERTQCEHCDAAFPMAEANGTEIFEPLIAG